MCVVCVCPLCSSLGRCSKVIVSLGRCSKVQVPDHHIEFSMTLQKVGLDNLSTSVGHDQNFLSRHVPQLGTEQ